jgi:soluble lytic murein transglycosylase
MENKMKCSIRSLLWLTIAIFLFFRDSEVKAKIFIYVDASGTIHLSNAPSSSQYRDLEEYAGIKISSPKIFPQIKNHISEIIEVVSREYDLDPRLVKAVIKAESDFNPWAISPKGAKGLMQLMPQTTQQCGVQNPFDIQENIECGIQYLASLLDYYQYDLERALAAYNAGKGAVEQFGGVPPFPETVNYINRVIYYYQNPWALNNTRRIKRPQAKVLSKVYRYFSPDGIILFTNVCK